MTSFSALSSNCNKNHEKWNGRLKKNKRNINRKKNKISVVEHNKEVRNYKLDQPSGWILTEERKPWIVDQSSDFFVYVC